MNNEFDIVIPLSPRDRQIVLHTIKAIKKHIKHKKIYLICKKSVKKYLESKIKCSDLNIIIIDENKLLPGLSFKYIESKLISKYGKKQNTGWYFQQILKLGFCNSEFCSRDYVVWDADTIPLRNIDFYSGKKTFFYVKHGIHEPYFHTIKKLIGFNKQNQISFITEFMLFKKDVLEDLLFLLCDKGKFGWIDIIFDNISKQEFNSFSEFELYGSYCEMMFPNQYIQKKIKAYRSAGLKYSRWSGINKAITENSHYDTISFEYQMHPPNFEGIIDRIFKASDKIYTKILF